MKKRNDNSRKSGDYSFIFSKKIKHPLIKIFVAILILILAGLMYYFEIPCPVKTLLGGIECPSCGLTKAVLACLRLDFAQAFSYNFMFWAIPVIALYYFYDGQPFTNKIFNVAVLILTVFGFLALFFMRIIEYSL